MGKHYFHGFGRAFFQIKIAASSVVQIGQHHKVADAGQSACHVVQFFALAWCIHIEKHNWIRTVFFWENYKGIHRAVDGLNVNVFFDHVDPFN